MRRERMTALLAAGLAFVPALAAPGVRRSSTHTPAGGRLLAYRRQRNARNRMAKASRRRNRKGGKR